MTGVSLSISSARAARRSSDPARVPLVGLADVDQLHLAAVDELLDALWLEIELVV